MRRISSIILFANKNRSSLPPISGRSPPSLAVPGWLPPPSFFQCPPSPPFLPAFGALTSIIPSSPFQRHRRWGRQRVTVHSHCGQRSRARFSVIQRQQRAQIRVKSGAICPSVSLFLAAEVSLLFWTSSAIFSEALLRQNSHVGGRTRRSVRWPTTRTPMQRELARGGGGGAGHGRAEERERGTEIISLLVLSTYIILIHERTTFSPPPLPPCRRWRARPPPTRHCERRRRRRLR